MAESLQHRLPFSSCEEHTVGIEWELQLLDMLSLDLVDGIVPLLEFFPDSVYVKPEYIQSCVEINSCPSRSGKQAVDHLRNTLLSVLARCGELDMSVCGGGTHPFCRRLALITPFPRYLKMEHAAGYPAHTQITFSTHVHVGMQSGDQAMRAMSRLIPALPAFIALSANSPFWRGHETGHTAYRHRILAAARNYGSPPRFDGWGEFEAFYDAAVRSQSIRHFKDIHWDIRPHPDFGTLEIRTMDSASDLRSLRGLVAFVRSLSVFLAHASTEQASEILPIGLPGWMENENRYRAGLLGYEADYIVNERGQYRALRDITAELIEQCEPTAADIGEREGLCIASEMLSGTPAYERQRRAYKDNHSTRAVVRALQMSLAESLSIGGTDSLLASTEAYYPL